MGHEVTCAKARKAISQGPGGTTCPRPLKERDTGRERGLPQVSLEVESFEDIGFVEDVLVAMREVVITKPTENQCVDRFDELVLEEEVLARMREASITATRSK
ncbi:hypothetical protein ZWY2020_011396 [Hordeum vulgare]|nr:hypothetical protein ZWY2020_011396 [Hordeum vulgare]